MRAWGCCMEANIMWARIISALRMFISKSSSSSSRYHILFCSGVSSCMSLKFLSCEHRSIMLIDCGETFSTSQFGFHTVNVEPLP
uniref:Putative ovule protein n=1 Tax=Solanum chacoense TaxID=4108 RepID=A0A0V0IR23_SOLCH